jgi:hypothetical protein
MMPFWEGPFWVGKEFTAEIAETAEKRLKKISHGPTRTHTDREAGKVRRWEGGRVKDESR